MMLGYVGTAALGCPTGQSPAAPIHDAAHILRGVIPSGAVLQAEGGISRAPQRLCFVVVAELLILF
jgi:hypothetical protein